MIRAQNGEHDKGKFCVRNLEDFLTFSCVFLGKGREWGDGYLVAAG